MPNNENVINLNSRRQLPANSEELLIISGQMYLVGAQLNLVAHWLFLHGKPNAATAIYEVAEDLNMIARDIQNGNG